MDEWRKEFNDDDMDYIYNMIEPCLHDIILDGVEATKPEFIRRLKIIINNRFQRKLSEAERKARIDENEYWLSYINRFEPHVPNHFRRANKHNFLDRIKELKGE